MRQKWLFLTTVVFTLLIVAIILAANVDALPQPLKRINELPGGDKAGHFVLFGILSFLLNRSALRLFPKRNPARLILTVSLFLSILIGLEEWGQALFPARTMSLADLLASYTGVTAFALLAYRTGKH